MKGVNFWRNWTLLSIDFSSRLQYKLSLITAIFLVMYPELYMNQELCSERIVVGENSLLFVLQYDKVNALTVWKLDEMRSFLFKFRIFWNGIFVLSIVSRRSIVLFMLKFCQIDQLSFNIVRNDFDWSHRWMVVLQWTNLWNFGTCYVQNTFEKLYCQCLIE